jgi:hypothetical protein
MADKPYARIAEKIPSSSHSTARLDDGIVIVSQLGLDAVCGVYTRYACTNDEHVEVRLIANFSIYRTHDGRGWEAEGGHGTEYAR